MRHAALHGQDSASLDAALAYAARGWLVVPCHGIHAGHCTCGELGCKSPGKHPRTAGGVRDATNDTSVIRAWWGRSPDANVGIAAGRRSGLLVLDVDPRHGGDVTLAELEAKHGPLPETVEAITGGHGRHILFAYPDGRDVGCSPGDLGPGLDVRGEGGFIVAAPSGHLTGGRYEWEARHHPDDCPLADPPRWLLALILAKSNGTARPLPRAIPEGARNQTLASVAGSMRRRGASAQAILAALRVENAARCLPPLGDHELRSIAASVALYAPATLAGNGTVPSRQAVREPAGFILTSLGDLLDEPEERVTWLVPEMMPMGGLIFVAAKPKVGKSTLVRNLALAVARGGEFLGRRCARGTTVYLGLEERRAEVRRHFREMGADRAAPVLVHVAKAPSGGLRALLSLIEEHRPILVVIDPLLRFTRVKDERSYAELSNALEGVMAAAREHNVAIVATHHAPKATTTEAIDALLGSTALSGAPDTVLVLRRQDQARTVETVQRYGSDLERTVLSSDPETGLVGLAGTVAEAHRQEVRRRVMEVIDEAEVSTLEIVELVEASKADVLRALNEFGESGRLIRSGAGRRGDPFRYRRPS